MMAGATFDDTTPDSVDEGDGGALRMSANRNLYVNLRDGAGNERAANVNANSRLEITIEEDNVGIGGGTQYAVDAALGATPTGTVAIAKRDDALSALTPVEGDAVEMRVDANGALWVIHSGVVSVDDNAGSLTVDNAALSVTGGGVEATALRVTLASDSTGVLTVDDGGGSLTVDGTVTASNTAGDVAHDGADSGNPVKIGAVAKETDATDPGSVAEDDRSDLRSDRNGRLLVNTAHPNLWDATENNSTAQTNNELKAAPGANLSLYVTDIVMSTDTAMNIKLVKNTAAPTDIAGPYYFAANGGIAIAFSTPIRVTANTNIGYTSSAAGNHTIEAHGYIAP
jgi:hypothetical protein